MHAKLSTEDFTLHLVINSVAQLQDMGLTHEQIKLAVSEIADVVEALDQANVNTVQFARAYNEPETLSKVANGGALAALGSLLPVEWAKSLGRTTLSGIGNMASGLVSANTQALINQSPTLALMGIAGPMAAGYVGGTALGNMSDDPYDKVDIIKHQEKLDAYAKATEELRLQRRFRQG